MMDDLYQELILDHAQRPTHFGLLAHATHSAKGCNPLCGDQLDVFLHVKDTILLQTSFQGEGCAICMASASLMCETLEKRTLQEALELFEEFHQMLTENRDIPFSNLGKCQAFLGVKAFPVRVKCATLPWHTLKAALEGNRSTPVCLEE